MKSQFTDYIVIIKAPRLISFEVQSIYSQSEYCNVIDAKAVLMPL